MQTPPPHDIKVSAILPNYNMADMLPRSLRSLLTQTLAFTEIIVVDDGSTDDSVAVIREICDKHPQVRLIQQEKNLGVNPALNTGLRHAIGDYVLLCAADDTYGHTLVEKSVDIITRYPAVGLVCGDAVVDRFDLDKPFYRTLPYPPHTLMTSDDFKATARKGFVCFNAGGGMLMNRQAIIEAGLVQPARWNGDWILYFVIAFRYGIYYINDVFIHITMRKASYSEGKRERTVQDNLILETLHIIYKQYPDVWPAFKKAGLLPHYALRYIGLLLSDPIGRQFMTPKVVWKIIINNAMVVRIGRLFPYRVILGMRKLLKA